MEHLIYFYIVIQVTWHVFKVEISLFLIDLLERLEEWVKKVEQEEYEELQKEKNKDNTEYF